MNDQRNFMPLFTDQKFKDLSTLKRGLERENKEQLQKWGIQTATLPEWMLWLTEEVGETAKAIAEFLYRGGSKEDVYNEAIQSATLSLKIAELMLQ